MNYQEQVNRLLAHPLTDYAGNTLMGVQDGANTKLYLYAKGYEHQRRMIGVLQVHSKHGVIYVKHEREADKHRNTKSWSVPVILLPIIDWVYYTTEIATYRISKDVVKRTGVSLPYLNGADKKLYVPVRNWLITMKERGDQRLLDYLGNDWYDELRPEFDNPYMKPLHASLSPLTHRYHPLLLTPFMDVRVVIFGSEPVGDTGLAWATPVGLSPSPASQLIMKEVSSDCYRGNMLHMDYTLTHWASQGVLLLNHKWASGTCDYTRFNTSILDRLLRWKRKVPLIAALWGKDIQQHYGPYFDPNSTFVLTADDPVTQPDTFYGCGHFSQINSLLRKHGSTPVKW